ncbi:MAG: hypothetical protein EOM72_11785 [Opitutae bacterium]|nr:hypothetical protein [Opitutae bacterium]
MRKMTCLWVAALGFCTMAFGSDPLDISGYVLTQANSAQTFTLPAGTMIPPSGYVIVARDTEKAAFQSAWSVTLGSNVVFVNSGNKVPQINGAETYTLSDAAAAVVDGPTPTSLDPVSSSVQRTALGGAASEAGNWTKVALASATPGTGAAGDGTAGLRISEYADATAFANEFVELFYDVSVVPPSNMPPVMASIGNKSVVEGNTLSFTVTATDAVDGDEIALIATALPAGATFVGATNAGTASSTFTWENAGPLGDYSATFQATDKDGTDTETISINVNDGTGPVAIAFQGFEGTAADTWGIADIDPALVLSTTGSGDTPANQRVRTDAKSWQPGEGEYATESMELVAVDVSAYSEVVLTLHLSATTTEIATDESGMWPEDNISFYLALDGNEYPATADMTVSGNMLEVGGIAGALWGFDATGVAATTAGVARTVAPATGGVTADGIATVQITLPPGTASVKLMGSVAQAYAGYFWNVDDISLAGIADGGASDYPPSISVSPDGLEKSVGVSNNLSFTITASEIPNDASDEVRVWATGLPAGATFAGATNVGGASSLFNWTPETAGTYPVSFYAGDKDGTNQVDVTITVYEGGGGTYAVVVGLNNYSPSYGASSLSGCVPDANHIYTNIIKRGEWNPLSVTRLLDSAATKAAIRAAIASYAATAVAGDTFFYFQSSHGGQNSGTSVYLCSYNANYEDTELAADLSAFATGVKVVVTVDACHSGGLFKSVPDGTRAERISKRGWDLAGIVSRIMDEQRAAKLAAGAKGVESRVSASEIGWITAADYDQYSYDEGPNGGGWFTDKLIEGWTNNPPASCDLNGDNYANFYELYDYSWDVANTEEFEYTTAMAHNTNVLLATIAGWVGEAAPGGLIVFSNMAAQAMIVGDTLNFPVGAYTAGTNVPATVTMTTVQDGASYADGVLTFTPTTDGTYTFNFTGTNANGGSATASLAVTATLPAPELADPAATAIGNDRFTANWNAVGGAASYLLDVATADTFSAGSGGSDLVSEGFATAAPDGWTMAGVGSYSSSPFVGTLLAGSLSIKFDDTGDSALTPAFAAGSATNLQFWAYGNGGSGSTFAISGLVNSVWTLLDTVVIAQDGATYNVALAPQTTQIGFYFTKVKNCALDDVVVQASDSGSSTLVLDAQSVAGTSYEVTGLDMDATYYFRVRAVGNLTGPNSETGSATTTATDTAPAFDAIPGQSATVGVLLALDVSAYDSGYPAPALSLVSSTAAGADYGFAGGTLSFTPSAAGDFEFVFQASNSLGTALATVNVAVASSPVYIPVATIDDLASTSFTLNWTPCTGATDYQMQVATNNLFAADSGGNLMENGGFETGDDTGWDVFEANYSVVTTDPQEGTYHVSCAATDRRALMQAVNITGDGVTEYEVSFWYKKPASGNARIWASWDTGGQVSGDSLQPATYLQAAAAWTKVTYRVVPRSGANVLKFEVRTYKDATVLWDNFFVGVAGGAKAAPRAILVDETVSALTRPVTGLTPETLYYARVRMAGGTWSEVVSATTLSSGPVAPAFAAIPAQSASVGVLFSLDVSTYDSGNPAPVLSLDSSTADAGDYSFAGGTLSFTPSVAGEFEFVFMASNELGTAMATATVTAVEGPVELLAPVIQAASAIGEEQFNANWLASAGATGYRLDVATNEAFRHTMGRRTATLAAGDLVIVTVNADATRGFDVVPLVDLDAGTVIHFTDNGWSNGTWRANEGTVTYTAPGAITAGTVLSYRSTTANGFVSNATFQLSGSGDTILAYQGSSNSPTFLYGVGWAIASPWVTGAVNANNSQIPAGLSAETYTIVTCGSSDNYQYDAANGTSGSAGTLLQWVASAGNWVGGDSTGYAKFTPDFTVGVVEQYNDFVPGYENLDVGNATSVAVTGLTEGVTYYYRAKATTATSNSPYSGTTSVVTTASAGTPPVLNAIGAQSVFLGETLHFHVSAAPTDEDMVTLSASNRPAGSEFYPTNELGTFLWTGASPTGTYAVTFRATDKDGADEETVSITVHPAPHVNQFAMSGDSPSAQFTSVAGRTYRLMYTTNLLGDPLVWEEADSADGTGGSITLTDDDPADPMRYYRLTAP